MKVTSPVGEFPFEFERIRFRGTRIVAEGRMGTWPARIEAGVSDIPAPIRATGAAAAGVLAVIAVKRRRRS
ncbi:hypothetical protein [Mycolicibacterium confluentis]|uniref:Uncharacterized protein n=1 Tax=Mycolicibacterium confluentis TaxID=28047 RepID=A0A7I7XS44_9MYCO|nr:hypothetical protein [Mycolicibacterium confluentis]MCV7318886.1 hypothetical protein [Mycolicibacterium confluentis]ORV23014.1 hypothetical protein AWB99_24070 [Mycolicibacterium confluentis]BBZ32038.1 hypothetical protein MCNF_06430 [Mycolicibacterium confluentis]